MSHAETLAVLRDAFVMSVLALVVAAIIYKLLRRSEEGAWNVEGNVLTRPYGGPDAAAALLLLSMFGAVFFAEAPLAAVGDAAEGGQEKLTLSALVLQAASMLVLCLLVLFYMAVLRGLNPAEMFGLRQMTVKRAFFHAIPALLLTLLGIWVVMALAMIWNGGELPETSPQETVEAFEKNGSPTFRLMLGFMAVITAPLTEELLFRGFLYGVIKRYTERWFAACFTSVIFAVVHFHVGTAPQLFLLGLGLAIAYEQTGCLLVPVFMHALFNAWNVTVLTVLSSAS